jgi:voltage-gated potassium channel
VPIFTKLLAHFYRDILELKVWVLTLVMVGFFIVSWVMFRLAGEVEIARDLTTYIYFAATTASTVGYGDISPQTDSGRLVAAFWFFPGSLLIFSAILGRLAGGMVERIRRMADGNGSYENLHGATVVVGYNRDQTPLMIENIIAGNDGDNKIVLLTKSTESEMPAGVKIVKSDRLDALASLKRAAIPHAEKVMVYATSDAETFNTCLAIRELNDTIHIAAFFEDRDTARRATRIAGLEAIVSNASEALVRAAQDPGAGQVLMALSAANIGATIYSATVGDTIEVGDLKGGLDQCDATLIAVSQPDQEGFLFAPFPVFLNAGGVLYYLCGMRLKAARIQSNLKASDVPITI